MWQSSKIWEQHKQINTILIKKLRAGEIQGMLGNNEFKIFSLPGSYLRT
jgi:hypothetical protein